MTNARPTMEELRADPIEVQLEAHRAGDSEDEAAEDIHTCRPRRVSRLRRRHHRRARRAVEAR
jgi:hypothetical protein